MKLRVWIESPDNFSFTNYLEACAVANECGGKVYELGLIKVR